MSESGENLDFKHIPAAAALETAGACEVYSREGKTQSFRTLIEDSHSKQAVTKTIVVFVRHFFCGSCQAYVRNLSKVSADALQEAGAQIIVVGCGQWDVIDAYSETTSFPSSSIFANPSRDLFAALGMTLETLQGTPAGQQRPSYLAGVGKWMNALTSTWRALNHPTLIGKQGPLKQLGGDFIFSSTADGSHLVCLFASRMRNTEDHISVEELMKAAGVSYTE